LSSSVSGMWPSSKAGLQGLLQFGGEVGDNGLPAVVPPAAAVLCPLVPPPVLPVRWRVKAEADRRADAEMRRCCVGEASQSPITCMDRRSKHKSAWLLDSGTDTSLEIRCHVYGDALGR
jgi:hypothetical protein